MMEFIGLRLASIFLFILSTSFVLAAEPIAIDQPTKLRGVLNSVTFPIPKDLNDINWAPDGKADAYVLVFNGLRTFEGPDPDKPNATRKSTLQMVHVIPADEARLKARLGKVIDLEGTPIWGSTRYHRTPVLLIEKPSVK
jgi:hypothetical protein